MARHDARLTRRAALKGAAGLVIGFQLPLTGHTQSGSARSSRTDGGSATFAPNAFIRIGTDDLVTVLIKHIEFGQGPFTGLATLVAEELDADWTQMRAEHAPSNPTLYKNFVLGMQGTGGSSAIANSYDQMRKAGATALAMLVKAAADMWNVAPSEIVVERGVLRHSATRREGRFGQFAEAAARQPMPEDPPLKQAASFRLIGREGAVKKIDVPEKTNGKAQFTIDIHQPGMLTVVVARPPRFGGKIASFDAADARSIPGVADVRQLPTGIAVFAEGMWPALKAREALRITWDDTAAEKRSSEQMIEEYRALARRPGISVAARGNVEAVLAKAGKVVEVEFAFPYLAHAPMEPLDGFLYWDGERARARFGCQLQTGDHNMIAAVLGLPFERVEIETMLAGGSFGRRGQADMHLAAELAQAAKAIGPGRPVKLVWTREDDIRGGYYRPLFLHRLRGAVSGGNIVAWADSIVGQSILKGTPFESIIKDGIDPYSVEGAREIPYDIADFRCELHTTDAAVPVLSWRSVGPHRTATANGINVVCFAHRNKTKKRSSTMRTAWAAERRLRVPIDRRRG
jgi:isoquinoline 1-oxidoreductase beta subunit